VSVAPNIWATIASKRYSDSLLHHGRVMSDGNNWFILMLEPFMVKILQITLMF
jgi:hypothetical protein